MQLEHPAMSEEQVEARLREVDERLRRVELSMSSHETHWEHQKGWNGGVEIKLEKVENAVNGMKVRVAAMAAAASAVAATIGSILGSFFAG